MSDTKPLQKNTYLEKNALHKKYLMFPEVYFIGTAKSMTFCAKTTFSI